MKLVLSLLYFGARAVAQATSTTSPAMYLSSSDAGVSCNSQPFVSQEQYCCDGGCTYGGQNYGGIFNNPCDFGGDLCGEYMAPTCPGSLISGGWSNGPTTDTGTSCYDLFGAGCTYQISSYTYSCCSCPAGFVPDTSGGGDCLASATTCVGCSDPTQTLQSDPDTGYYCAAQTSSIASSMSSTSSGPASTSTISFTSVTSSISTASDSTTTPMSTTTTSTETSNSASCTPAPLIVRDGRVIQRDGGGCSSTPTTTTTPSTTTTSMTTSASCPSEILIQRDGRLVRRDGCSSTATTTSPPTTSPSPSSTCGPATSGCLNVLLQQGACTAVGTVDGIANNAGAVPLGGVALGVCSPGVLSGAALASLIVPIYGEVAAGIFESMAGVCELVGEASIAGGVLASASVLCETQEEAYDKLAEKNCDCKRGSAERRRLQRQRKYFKNTSSKQKDHHAHPARSKSRIEGRGTTASQALAALNQECAQRSLGLGSLASLSATCSSPTGSVGTVDAVTTALSGVCQLYTQLENAFQAFDLYCDQHATTTSPSASTTTRGSDASAKAKAKAKRESNKSIVWDNEVQW